MKLLFISDIHGYYNNLEIIEKQINNQKIDKLIVPTTDLAKKDFPILYPENKNKGTFKTIFVIPIGILNK